MKFLFPVILLIILIQPLAAQNKSDDSLALEIGIAWLEDKLTYNYYNTSDGEWWINRFTYNDSRTITIKNIASPRIEAVTDKTYLQLNFELEELNPYTIKIEDIKSNAGRLVEGKAIRVGAYHYDKTIRRIKNGRLATNQSFIYFSIPKYLEDSVENYSQAIVEKLTNVIMLSTRLYPRLPGPQSATLFKKLIRDRFISGTTYWEIRNIYNNVFEVEVQDKTFALLEKRFLRISDNGEQLELTIVKPDKETVSYILNASPANGLVFENELFSISFKNKNEFTFIENGTKLTFLRDWNYEYSLAKYR